MSIWLYILMVVGWMAEGCFAAKTFAKVFHINDKTSFAFGANGSLFQMRYVFGLS